MSVDFPIGDFTWRVSSFLMEDEDAARLEWERLERESNGANYSVWRVLDAEGRWLVVTCGAPENLPTVNGEPIPMTEGQARYFALRRARVGLDAGGHSFNEVGRYGASGGRIITPDGELAPAPEGSEKR